MNFLRCANYRLSLERPLVMGIVNLTPDSFSGDGLARDTVRAIEHAHSQMLAGVDMLDIGAESSRPGAIATPEGEELSRLMPVLREIVTWNVPISIDTYKPRVMRAALDAGAAMINDITGMANPEALAAVAESDCGVCVMHMQGDPGSMQKAPEYASVVDEVKSFLAAAIQRCRDAGIDDGRLVLDPGFGFGKTLEHNLDLLRNLAGFELDGLPVLAGLSRKSMLGAITGRPVEERMPASIAAAMLAAQNGAKILRVHDVAATRDALGVLAALQGKDKK